MDRSQWQKKYQEQCYMPVAKQYLEQLLDGISENATEINKELNEQLNAFLQSLCMLQENAKLGPVRTVSISFPYTSLVCNSPQLLFEVYPNYPFIDEMEIAKEFPVSWLFPKWGLFLEQLHDEAGMQGMSAIIRMPYIRAHAWGIARVILKIMSSIVKYHLYGLEEMQSYDQLQKADDFTLFFGEYMDWQKPILAVKEEIDIFNCNENTDLRFRHFHKAWYENKVFENLDLDDCQFKECTFKNCQLSGCSFKDARFLGCIFINSSFVDLKLEGARFDGCKLEDVSMAGIQTNSFLEKTSSQIGMQGMTEFLGCFLKKIKFSGCDFSASYYLDCKIHDAKTEESVLPDSYYNCLE